MSFPRSPLRGSPPQDGAALIIVLAFVVLLTGVVLAFFSRAMGERQVSNSSANQTRVELFAQGATDSVLGDLEQEIAAGSTVVSPATGVNVYVPRAALNAVPNPVGTPASSSSAAIKTGMASLIKRSVYNYTATASNPVVGPMPFYANPSPTPASTPYDTVNYPPSKRAAPVSTLFASLNGRSISPARWNKHLLLEKATAASAATSGMPDTNNTDFTPVGATYPPGTPPPTLPAGSAPSTWVDGASNSLAPDWVLVARDGTNPTAWNTNMVSSSSNVTSVNGRYAYAIYDEGGLLDVNAAGFPLGAAPPSGSLYYTNPTANFDVRAAYKNGSSFADLSQLPGFSSLSLARQQGVINSLVGWRNYASVQPTGALSPGMAGFTFGTAAYTNFTNAVLGNFTGFMRTNNPAVVNGQSDRLFSSRQALLNLLLQGIAANGTGSATEQANLQNALQYLGTFSREINQPSFSFDKTSPLVAPMASGGNPAVGSDGNINPGKANTNGGTPPYPAGFLSITVQTAFARNDGTMAIVGEPLVKRRFALNRLAWLTCNGPIADDSGNLNPLSDSLIGLTVTELENRGVPAVLLQQGGQTNIKKYFGLSWDSTNRRWVYDQHNGTTGSGSSGAITRVGFIPGLTGTGLHEPDFFELLKSGINAGSLGKSFTNSANNENTLAPGYLSKGGSTSIDPYDYQYKLDSSTDYQVIQIGANIIEQANVAGYPIRIAFNAGNGIQEFRAVDNLPYLYHVHYGLVQLSKATTPPPSGSGSYPFYAVPTSDTTNGTLADPGTGVLLQFPTLWNPHDILSSRGRTVNSTKLYPTSFRVFVDSASPTDNGSGDYTGGYDKYYAYGFGSNQNSAGATIAGVTNQSYNAATASPAITGTFAGQSSRIMAQALTSGNTELDFAVDDSPTGDDTNGTLFREPTPLLRQGYAGLKSVNPLLINGLTAFNVDPLGFQNPQPGYNTVCPFSITGIYMGAIPLRWIANDSSSPAVPYTVSAATAQCARYYSAATTSGGDDVTNCFLTYRLQCRDSAGNWMDYDTKYVPTYMSAQGSATSTGNGNGTMSFNYNQSRSILIASEQNYSMQCGTSGVCDPRTSRFGMQTCQTSTALSDDEIGIPGPEAINNQGSGGFSGNVGSWSRGYVDTTVPTLTSDRPDQAMGYSYWKQGSTQVSAWSDQALSTSGWATARMTLNPNPWGLRVGVFSQNDPDYPATMVPCRFLYDGKYRTGQSNSLQPTYYSDADGVVRRAMGAYVGPAAAYDYTTPSGVDFTRSTTIGLPMARALNYAAANLPPNYNYPSKYPQNGTVPDSTLAQNQFQSRPVILHRPFRTVAELGYTFTGTPWKNLDFFTPESGSAGLLDLFCINDTDDANGLMAGKVDLNTHQVPVLQAVLANAYKDDDRSTNAANPLFLSSGEASTLANVLVTRTTAGNINSGSVAAPLSNVSQLVGKWTGTATAVPALPSPTPSYPVVDGGKSYDGFSKDIDNLVYATGTGLPNASFSSDNIQRFHEAPIRALAGAGQTRCWNLLIDMVAQVGRYPASAANASNPLAAFVVEGEQRCWVHVAVDRYTGKVLDKQVEIVKE